MKQRLLLFLISLLFLCFCKVPNNKSNESDPLLKRGGTLYFDKSVLNSNTYRSVSFRPVLKNFNPSERFVKDAEGNFSLTGSSIKMSIMEKIDTLMASLTREFQGYFGELSSRNDNIVDSFYKGILAARLSASKVLTKDVADVLKGKTLLSAILPRPGTQLHYFSRSPFTLEDGTANQSGTLFHGEDPQDLYANTVSFIEQSAKNNKAKPPEQRHPYLVGAYFKLYEQDNRIWFDVRIIMGLPPMNIPVGIVDERSGVKIHAIVVPEERAGNKQPLLYLDTSIPLLNSEREDFTWQEVISTAIIHVFFGNLGSYSFYEHMFSPRNTIFDQSRSLPYAQVEKPIFGPLKNVHLAIGEFYVDPTKVEFSDLNGYVSISNWGHKIFFPINLESLPWLGMGDVKGQIKTELNNFLSTQESIAAFKTKFSRLLEYNNPD